MSVIKNPTVIDATEISDDEMNALIDGTINPFEEGDLVTGTIVKLDRDEVLLDIGFKSEGVIPVRELSIRRDVDPSEVVNLGDQIEALVLQKEDKDGRLILSKKRAEYERAWISVEEKFNNGENVEGEVIEVVKGGLILDIGLRGFLPASLVDLRRVKDLSTYIHSTLEARVIEMDRNRNNVVLSRRVVLEEGRKAERAEVLAKLAKGMHLKGVVSSIVDFGAFVDLGGIDGLVHISELSWNRIKPLLPQEEENEIDEVKVKKTHVEALKVKHLSFTYPDGKKILDDISFSAKKGQIIGITGAVACGKSTLGKAFLCEYPYEGHITVDGAELQNMEQSVRTGIVGYLGHDPELFNGSVENNVLFGDSKNSDTYLNAACMKQEVAEMTDGKNTLIGSGGAYLSGGQAKRLAFARTLCHDKPILILDDPFSALDKNTEKQAFVNLQALAKDSIVLLISHRLYLFPEMDGVIWMENGKAVTGTHEELLKTVPEYENLYTSQVHTAENGGAEHDAQKTSENGDL